MHPRDEDLRISGMAFDARSGGIGPGTQLRIGSVPALLRPGLGNVSHGVGTPSQVDETRRPVGGIDGQRVKHGGQRVDGIAELLPRDRVGVARLRDVGERFSQQPDGIVHPGEQIRPDGRLLP